MGQKMLGHHESEWCLYGTGGELEYAITEEAHKRYEQIVLLLMKDAPAHYLK